MKAHAFISGLIVVLLLLLTNILYSQNKVIFKESFDQKNSDWVINTDYAKLTKVENGNFYFSNGLGSDNYYINTKDIIDVSNEFALEMKMAFVNGSDYTQFGIIYAYKDEKNYKLFTITNGINFYVHDVVDGIETRKCGPARSKAILKDDYNKLSVYMIGEYLYHQVNGVTIAKTKYKGFYGNKIGFFNGGGHHNLAINVDEVVYRLPEQSEKKSVVDQFLKLDEKKIYATKDDPFTRKFKKAFAQVVEASNYEFQTIIDENEKVDIESVIAPKSYPKINIEFPKADKVYFAETKLLVFKDKRYRFAPTVVVHYDCRKNKTGAIWNNAIYDAMQEKIYVALMESNNTAVGGKWTRYHVEKDRKAESYNMLVEVYYYYMNKSYGDLIVFVQPDPLNGFSVRFILPGF